MRRALRRNVTGLVAPRPEAGGVGVSVGVGAAFRPITESTCRLTAASASLIGSRWSRGDGATAVFPKPSISSSVVPTALPGLSRPLARPSNSSRALVVRALAARGDLSGGLPASYAVALLARELRHERRPKGEEAALLASSRALAQTPPTWCAARPCPRTPHSRSSRATSGAPLKSVRKPATRYQPAASPFCAASWPPAIGHADRPHETSRHLPTKGALSGGRVCRTVSQTRTSGGLRNPHHPTRVSPLAWTACPKTSRR